MKKVFKLLGIIAFVAVIGIAMLACSNGSTGGNGPGKDPSVQTPGEQQPDGQQPGGQTPGGQQPGNSSKKAEYVSYSANGTEYKLVITDAATGRAAYDWKPGHRYTLTITEEESNESVTSTGNVTGVNEVSETEDSITIKHTETEEEITVDVDSNTGAIKKFRGNNKKIPVDRGRGNDVPMPEVLTYYFDINRNGYILWQGIVKPNGEADIPATFRRKPVVAIGWYAFYENTDLKSVTIPAGVKEIGGMAFFVNPNLPSGVFSYVSNLETVTFEAGSKLETIGDMAFYGCTGISVITIPASVTSISQAAFNNCRSLETLTFEAGSKLETIGDNAFGGCTSLSGTITIPSSVTSIGDRAFHHTNVSAITIPAGVTSIGDYTFYSCYSLTSITFAPGSQLQTIGDFAFYGTSLSAITIPAGVKSIGDCALGGSASLISLTSITFAPDSQLQTIGDLAFGGTSISGAITIPAGVTSIGRDAFFGCKSLTSITFAPGSQLQTIGNSAFGECTSISGAITIPASVTSMGYSVFYNWTALSTINIQGKANRAATIAAGWDDKWDNICYAVINYGQ